MRGPLFSQYMPATLHSDDALLVTLHPRCTVDVTIIVPSIVPHSRVRSSSFIFLFVPGLDFRCDTSGRRGAARSCMARPRYLGLLPCIPFS